MGRIASPRSGVARHSAKMHSRIRKVTLHLVTIHRIESSRPINLNGFTLVGPKLARRAITGNTMASTRALRIRRNANAATGPHRIGADRIARSDQEPQPLRSRPAARA